MPRTAYAPYASTTDRIYMAGIHVQTNNNAAHPRCKNILQPSRSFLPERWWHRRAINQKANAFGSNRHGRFKLRIISKQSCDIAHRHGIKRVQCRRAFSTLSDYLQQCLKRMANPTPFNAPHLTATRIAGGKTTMTR